MDKELGRLAYEAYRETAGGVSLASGDKLPLWIDLTVGMQEAWRAAADAVRLAND